MGAVRDHSLQDVFPVAVGIQVAFNDAVWPSIREAVEKLRSRFTARQHKAAFLVSDAPTKDTNLRSPHTVRFLYIMAANPSEVVPFALQSVAAYLDLKGAGSHWPISADPSLDHRKWVIAVPSLYQNIFQQRLLDSDCIASVRLAQGPQGDHVVGLIGTSAALIDLIRDALLVCHKARLFPAPQRHEICLGSPAWVAETFAKGATCTVLRYFPKESTTSARHISVEPSDVRQTASAPTSPAESEAVVTAAAATSSPSLTDTVVEQSSTKSQRMSPPSLLNILVGSNHCFQTSSITSPGASTAASNTSVRALMDVDASGATTPSPEAIGRRLAEMDAWISSLPQESQCHACDHLLTLVVSLQPSCFVGYMADRLFSSIQFEGVNARMEQLAANIERSFEK